LEKLKEGFGDTVEPDKGFRLESFVGSNIPSLIYTKSDTTFHYSLKLKKMIVSGLVTT